MKKFLTLALCSLSTVAYAQDKTNYISYNKLIDVKGTDYAVATVANWSKISVSGKYLLFVNTKTGERLQADLPRDCAINNIEQVKIDSLKLNVIVVNANTVDLDGKNGIDWNDPDQLLVFSPDGKQRTKITEDKFFVQAWTVNHQTGCAVIAGHYDTNNNGKYDKTDKHEILIYNLTTMTAVSKL